MTVILALISLVLLSALGASLTMVMSSEVRATANYAASREYLATVPAPLTTPVPA